MREPAESPSAARKRYARFLQLTLSCVTKDIWKSGEIDEYSALITSNASGSRLKREDGPPLSIVGSQLFEIVPDDRYEGEFRTHTLQYIYTVAHEDGRELVSWHWHPLLPGERDYPHLHVGVEIPELGLAFSKAHVPTGRVSFESVVNFCISDLGVVTIRDDWKEIIQDSEQRFRAFSSWGGKTAG